MAPMETDYLIALDTAHAELGDLYVLARRFRALRDDADRDLLAKITDLGLQLRKLCRHAELTEATIEEHARQVQSVRREWLDRIDAVKDSAPYRAASAAYEANAQQELARVLPAVVAGIEIVDPVPDLYFGVRVSRPRRGPGSPPFVDSATCVERVLERVRDGLQPPADDELGFAHLTPGEDPESLDSPVSLRLAPSASSPALFRSTDDFDLHVYTPSLAGPFTPALCLEFEDPWWRTNDESYEEFRQRVAEGLGERGCDVVEVGTGAR